MKKNIFSIVIFTVLSYTSHTCKAQSLSDWLNNGNISKVVNFITKETENINITGTWIYSGSAVEFKSDNLLMKTGGVAAATITENKLNKQLIKVGITKGQMSFTFNADSTFMTKVGKKKLEGTYSYNKITQQVNLKYLRMLSVYAKINCTSTSIELLFNSDKLMKLMALIGSKTNSTAIKTVSSIADNYDGMMLGFEMKKQQF